MYKLYFGNGCVDIYDEFDWVGVWFEDEECFFVISAHYFNESLKNKGVVYVN